MKHLFEALELGDGDAPLGVGPGLWRWRTLEVPFFCFPGKPKASDFGPRCLASGHIDNTVA